jgi:hypothetical protein
VKIEVKSVKTNTVEIQLTRLELIQLVVKSAGINPHDYKEFTLHLPCAAEGPNEVVAHFVWKKIEETISND